MGGVTFICLCLLVTCHRYLVCRCFFFLPFHSPDVSVSSCHAAVAFKMFLLVEKQASYAGFIAEGAISNTVNFCVFVNVTLYGGIFHLRPKFWGILFMQLCNYTFLHIPQCFLIPVLQYWYSRIFMLFLTIIAAIFLSNLLPWLLLPADQRTSRGAEDAHSNRTNPEEGFDRKCLPIPPPPPPSLSQPLTKVPVMA